MALPIGGHGMTYVTSLTDMEMRSLPDVHYCPRCDANYVVFPQQLKETLGRHRCGESLVPGWKEPRHVEEARRWLGTLREKDASATSALSSSSSPLAMSVEEFLSLVEKFMVDSEHLL